MQAETKFAIGNTIATQRDRYELLSELGRGGMGLVFKAHEVSLDRLVALKTFQDEFDSTAMRRFLREAKLVAQLVHPGIVSVYSTDVYEGTPFLVMEYIQGSPLNVLLHEHGPLALPQFYQIFSNLLSALDYCHQQGVVHRDIKPGNILVTADGIAKLTDFGIAKAMSSEQMQRVTRTGTMMGSPAYMSPEQCRAEDVDARSDIYSIACTMYEALTGEPPFKGESALDVMYQHINAETRTLSDIGGVALSAVLAKALQKDPARRFATAAEFREALLKAHAGEATVESRIRRKSPGRRHITMRTAAFGAAFAFCALVGCYWHYSDTEFLGGATSTEDLTDRLSQQFEALRIQREKQGELHQTDLDFWIPRLERVLKVTENMPLVERTAGMRFETAKALISLYKPDQIQEKLAMYKICFACIPKAWQQSSSTNAYLQLFEDMRLEKLYAQSLPLIDQFEKEALRTNNRRNIANAKLCRGLLALDQEQFAQASSLLQDAVEQYALDEPEATSLEHMQAYKGLMAALSKTDKTKEQLQAADQAFRVADKMPITTSAGILAKFENDRRLIALYAMNACTRAVDYKRFRAFETAFLAAAAETPGMSSPTSESEDQIREQRARMATALFIAHQPSQSYSICKHLVPLAGFNANQKATRVAAYLVLAASAEQLCKWQEAIDAAKAAEDLRNDAGRPDCDTVGRAEHIMAIACARLHHPKDAKVHFELATTAFRQAPAGALAAERVALEREKASFERGELN